MVPQLSAHRRKTELYLRILNKALEVGDHHLACLVKNRLKHHHHQDYAIATPTGGVIIRFPSDAPTRNDAADLSYLPRQKTRPMWQEWAIGLSVFPGSLLVMVGLVVCFS